MRIIVADLTATYSGRLDTHLPRATRTILIKEDGTLLIHADTGGKPLNWMSPPTSTYLSLSDSGEEEWVVTNPKTGETLHLSMHHILSDTTHTLGFEPGLIKDGAEEHLQKMIAVDPSDVLRIPGYQLVRREYSTPIGPVDLLLAHTDGHHAAVEVKRNGHLPGVDQLSRYLEFLNREPHLAPVHGIYAAQTITPQARTLAEDRGIMCVLLDYELLRDGVIPDDPDPVLF